MNLMDHQKLNAISTAVIAYVTALGVLFAMIYYMFIMININFVEGILGTIIYIDIILLFLYILKIIHY